MQPLREAKLQRLRDVMQEVSIAGVRSLYRLASATADLLDDPRADAVLAQPPDVAETIHSQIAERLSSVDSGAADNLREAYEWLGAILSALLSESRTEVAAAMRHASQMPEPTQEEIREELRGSAGVFLRGLLWTIASLEAVLDSSRLPETIGRWCELALLEIHAAANMLRAEGIDVLTAVTERGREVAQSRRRLPIGLRPGPLPPGVMEVIVTEVEPEEIWLYGSRAMGTYGPSSDWDLLVVVPDVADIGSAKCAATLRSLRRQRVDLVFVRRSDFESGKRARGSLSHVAVKQGYRVR